MITCLIMIYVEYAMCTARFGELHVCTYWAFSSLLTFVLQVQDLIGELAGRELYVGGWVWPRTTTCYVNSAASFHKCIGICIFKVCNNVYLALPVFKFTNLVNDL